MAISALALIAIAGTAAFMVQRRHLYVYLFLKVHHYNVQVLGFYASPNNKFKSRGPLIRTLPQKVFNFYFLFNNHS